LNHHGVVTKTQYNDGYDGRMASRRRGGGVKIEIKIN
jgi:hypothetical protein